MQEELLVYLDGKLVPKSEAKLSVYDHGLLYGDGVFEGIRAFEGSVFMLKEHIERLYESAGFIELKIPLSKEEMTEALLQTLRKNNLHSAYIRMVITRGIGDMGVNPSLCKQSSVFIITEPVAAVTFPREPKVVSTVISNVRRDSVDATTHEVKSLNYLNSVMAMLDSNRAGVDYPIMLDSRGYVSEGPTMNIFIVKKGEIMTPATSSAILHGITRARLMDLCRDLHREVVEKDITPFELGTADEAFFSGTLLGLAAIGSVNKKPIGSGSAGPITSRIHAAFRELVIRPEEGTQIYPLEQAGQLRSTSQ